MADGPSNLPHAPLDAIDPSGEPRFGAYAGSLERIGLLRAAPRGGTGALRGLLQRKRWVYVFAANEEAMVAAAVVEAGWFAAGLAWLNARVTDEPGEGARARFSGIGLRIEIEQREGRVELGLVGRNGFRAEVVLDASGAPAPFVLVTPVAGPGVRATQKAAAMSATGTISVGGRTLLLDGGSGGLDSTHGFLARETGWRWAFGTGRLPGGAPIGFNLAEGFAGVPEGDPGENALFRSYETSRLPPCAFSFDRDQPRSPWRVASADGSVELAFTPAALHREVKNLVVLKTRFSQLPGTFSGRLPGLGGPVELAE